MAAYQQAVGIDAVWRACYERAVVLPRFYFEVVQLVGKHYPDLVYFVCERVVEDVQHERVALLQPVEVNWRKS